jgi:hypothetical protein
MAGHGGGLTGRRAAAVLAGGLLGVIGDPAQQLPYPSSRSTPTVDNGTLYALSSDGDPVSLRASDGRLICPKNLRADFGGEPGRWAYAESPLMDGEVLVVTPGGKSATMVALQKKAVAVIWRSAIHLNAAGRGQSVQFLDQGVVEVDTKTGEFLWRYEKMSMGPTNLPMPVAFENHVYSSNSRRFGGGVAAEAFLTGERKWKTEMGPGSVLFADGRLSMHRENGEARLVEAHREKGDLRRRTVPNTRAAGRRRGLIPSSPTSRWTSGISRRFGPTMCAPNRSRPGIGNAYRSYRPYFRDCVLP